MKVAVYSPYLHIMGGGERYILSIAAHLAKRATVYCVTDTNITSGEIRRKAEMVFGLDAGGLHFIPKTDFFPGRFDILFYVTDGSIFFPNARKNFLIIQSPSHIPGPSILNRLKLRKWIPVCYSVYIERIIRKRLPVNPVILPPPVDTDIFTPGKRKKEKIILSVGRFFPQPHNKKQEFLAETFIRHHRKEFNGWKLVLAGGLTEEGGREIIGRIREKTAGYPVEIMENIGVSMLKDVYAKSSIYWHAAGFGENLEKFPERAEHYGITTLEAMAAGCVPVVIDAGGQKELVRDGVEGYLWKNRSELVVKTSLIIRNRNLMEKFSRASQMRAKDYSNEKFYEKIDRLIV